MQTFTCQGERTIVSKKNCWEYKECDREPGGDKVEELGICPAATEKRLDGVHGGRNAGRACWVIAGTFCGGEVQGSYANKYPSCMDCDFFKLVIHEELAKSVFLFPPALLAKLA